MFFCDNDYVENGLRKFNGALWEGAFPLRAKIDIVEEYDPVDSSEEVAVVM